MPFSLLLAGWSAGNWPCQLCNGNSYSEYRVEQFMNVTLNVISNAIGIG